MLRVGFIVDSKIPGRLDRFGPLLTPHRLLPRWRDRSAMKEMRFRWVAKAVAAQTEGQVRYALYSPGRRYDVVVFLKSMGPACLRLATELRGSGTKIIFEANVDYYTGEQGESYYDGMIPTEVQKEHAVAMTRFADGVIGSSRHLTELCAAYSPHVQWVPDNVDFDLVEPRSGGATAGPLDIWWSGEAVKLFELLAIEGPLAACSDQVHLHLVTNSLTALDRWHGDLKERFHAMLRGVPHTIHRFTDLRGLLCLYSRGGIIISPRFLSNAYNLAHTEWKIALGMACGLPAVCSPVPSYRDIQERAGERAVTICENDGEWIASLRAFQEQPEMRFAAGTAARKVVEEFYATPVVARTHRDFVESIANAAAEPSRT